MNKEVSAKKSHDLGNGVTVVPTIEEYKPAMMTISSQIWEGDDYLPHIWSRWMKEGGFHTILQDGVVVGCMKHTLMPGNEILLEGLRMDPDRQGKGFASIAVDFFMELVHSLKPSVIRFATSDENVFSRHFGEKHGFQFVTAFHHRFFKRPDAEAVLERILEKDREKADDDQEAILHSSGASGKIGEICSTSIEDLDKVMTYLESTPEWSTSKGLISHGWVFHPFAREGIKGFLSTGHSFVHRDPMDSAINGILLAEESQQYQGDVDISWLSGTNEIITDLLTEFMRTVDLDKANEIAGKTPSSKIAMTMEAFGFIEHDRVDCAVVFEKKME